jgi:hypothetical protein
MGISLRDYPNRLISDDIMFNADEYINNHYFKDRSS